MPDFDYRVSKMMERKLQLQMNSLVERPGMTRENPEYTSLAQKLDGIGRAIDDYESENRVTDEQGKLLKPPATRTPAMFQPEDQKEYKWHFEPTVAEARAALRRDPALLQRLDPTGEYSHVVRNAGSDPYVTMADPMAPQGAMYHPTETWLDHLTEDNKLYKDYAEEAWTQRLEQARSRYEGVRRYRDVPFEGEPAEFLSGGVEKGVRNVAAPAALGFADAMTANQASPAYDAARDLTDYRLGRMSPEELENAKSLGFGFTPENVEALPHSEDIKNRGPISYMAGNLRGYGSRLNPTNLVQKGISDAMGYEAADVGGRLLAAGVAGGVSNAAESVAGDMARYANEGDSIPIGEAGKQIGINAVLSGLGGLIMGGLFDAGGQGMTLGREKFVGLNRNAPLRTIEQGGGSADIVSGAVPPPEVEAAFEQNRKNRYDPTKAPTTAAGDMSSALAPEIERSVRTRSVNQQDAIGKQMSDYYAHPDYRDIHGTTKPALEGLIKQAGEGMGRSATTGSSVPVNAPQLKRIGNVLREYADPPLPISDKLAYTEAAKTGAIVIPAELANHLFADVLDPVPRGQSVLLQPIEINAQALTKMEERIYDELGISKTRGMNNDPVWQTINTGIKNTRDQFPLYQDESGNLVGIPPDSVRNEPFPMDPSAVPKTDEMRVLNPPEQVRGGPQQRPPGMLAVGDEFNPIPAGGPFDQRTGSREVNGVVDGPRNPLDPGFPTSQEAVRPLAMRSVTGGEYGPPPPLDPNARIGIGPRDNQGPVQSFTAEGLPIPGAKVSPQATQQVQGSYNRPPEVQMERAPTTERNPYGHVNRGQPEPEVPLPPSNRSDELAARGMDEKLHQREYGKTQPTAEPENSLLEGNKLAMPDRGAELLKGFPSNQRVQLVDVRAKLGDMPRAEQDELLRQMQDAGELVLYRNDNTPSITKADKEAAMDVAGFPRHLVYFTPGGRRGAASRKGPTGPTGVTGATGARASDERGGLEQMLDAQLERAHKVPQKEIDEIGALQTADREQVARAQKEYVEGAFSKGKAEHAREVAKVEALAKDQKVIEEAMGQIQDIDKRLGPLTPEEKGQYLADIVSQKTGQKVTVEDLVRLGIMAAGLLQMATSDDEDGGAAGAAIFGFGLGRGRKPESDVQYGPARPKKPTEPTFKLENGETVKGFSAMRAQQHEGQTAIEDAMRRLGVEGDTTLEGRIRTFGQLDDRGKIDQALLNEAIAIDKADELKRASSDSPILTPPPNAAKRLRQAAAANAYAELKDRAWFGDLKGFGNKLFDFIGYRLYRGSEYLGGRFTREHERNPFAGEPDSTLGRMMRAHVQEPARRLLNLTEGGPASRAAARKGADWIKDKFMSDDEEERRRQSASP